MAEMKTLNGYEVVDAKARQDIKNLADTTKQSLADIEVAIPSLEGYATEQWVEDKNYLTDEDISGKSDVGHTHNITELEGYIEPVDSYTKAEVDNKTQVIDDEIRQLNSDMQNKADSSHTHTMSEITDLEIPEGVDLTGYATEDYVDDAVETCYDQTQTWIRDCAPKSHQHTMADITDYEAPSFDGYATEDYVDEKVEICIDDAQSNYNTLRISIENCATKTELNSVQNNLSTNYWSAARTSSEIQSANTEVKNLIPKTTNQLTNDSGFITTAGLNSYATIDYVQGGYIHKTEAEKYITQEQVDLSIQEAINNLDETDLSNYYTKADCDAKFALISSIPTDDYINNLINKALGGIENGTY